MPHRLAQLHHRQSLRTRILRLHLRHLPIRPRHPRRLPARLTRRPQQSAVGPPSANACQGLLAPMVGLASRAHKASIRMHLVVHRVPSALSIPPLLQAASLEYCASAVQVTQAPMADRAKCVVRGRTRPRPDQGRARTHARQIQTLPEDLP